MVTAMDNGKDVMAEAYAQMQKADALVFCDVGGSNHTMMVVDVSACTVPLAELVTAMEESGKEKGLSIRVQREDIFEAMHRI